MKKFATILALVLAFGMSAIALTACARSNGGKTSNSAEEPQEDLGFTEVEMYEGDEEWEEGYLSMAGVYFQPADLNDGSDSTKFSCHIELDVSAMAGNNFGFGEGDWVPYLTVQYRIVAKAKVSGHEAGDEIAAGTFMPMAASDGPHYGANVKMAGTGTYEVTFTVSYPGSDTYLMHTDEKTGPGGVYPTASYTFTKEWNYIEGAWDAGSNT